MARKGRYCYDYPRPEVSTDVVLFRLHHGDLQVLLIKRKHAPYKGKWAVPGGFVEMKESLEESAIRELAEETGITKVPFLMQLGAYGNPKRDPRARVIDISFIGIVGDDAIPEAGDDAVAAEWIPIECVPEKLAFDHNMILRDALERLVQGGRNSGLLFTFLPKTFTLEQLQQILDIIYGAGINAKDYLQYFINNKLVRRFRGGKKFQYKTALAEPSD